MLLRSLSPRSSGERATASGAVSAGSNPVGGTGQRLNSNTLTILVRPSPDLRPAETQTRPGPRPRKQDPSRGSPAQRPTITTAARPLPCPKAVAPPPNIRSQTRQSEQRRQCPGTAGPPGMQWRRNRRRRWPPGGARRRRPRCRPSQRGGEPQSAGQRLPPPERRRFAPRPSTTRPRFLAASSWPKAANSSARQRRMIVSAKKSGCTAIRFSASSSAAAMGAGCQLRRSRPSPGESARGRALPGQVPSGRGRSRAGRAALARPDRPTGRPHQPACPGPCRERRIGLAGESQAGFDFRRRSGLRRRRARPDRLAPKRPPTSWHSSSFVPVT